MEIQQMLHWLQKISGIMFTYKEGTMHLDMWGSYPVELYPWVFWIADWLQLLSSHYLHKFILLELTRGPLLQDRERSILHCAAVWNKNLEELL